MVKAPDFGQKSLEIGSSNLPWVVVNSLHWSSVSIHFLDFILKFPSDTCRTPLNLTSIYIYFLVWKFTSNLKWLEAHLNLDLAWFCYKPQLSEPVCSLLAGSMYTHSTVTHTSRQRQRSHVVGTYLGLFFGFLSTSAWPLFFLSTPPAADSPIFLRTWDSRTWEHVWDQSCITSRFLERCSHSMAT